MHDRQTSFLIILQKTIHGDADNSITATCNI